jgi:hypothetical protein
VISAIPNLDPKNYARHMLHAEERVWVEKNCYIDIWLEVLNALGLEPRAVLPFVLAIDFEGDQWTFFKPPHEELRDLYGVDVQELNVWRPLLDHAVEYLGAGKLISTEADAFYLPDTSGTDYKTKHTKTTIVLNALDVEGQRLGYFHNAGYYELSGDDFVKTFRVNFTPDLAFMPLFAEAVRFDRLMKRSPEELRTMSRALAKRHLGRRPIENPVERFAKRFPKDLGWLTEEGLAFYHAWAFGTVRQLGAAFELAAVHARWLAEAGESEAPLGEAAQAFDKISSTSKAFILKAARAVNSKKGPDAVLPGIMPMFDEMAAAWASGMRALEGAL